MRVKIIVAGFVSAAVTLGCSPDPKQRLEKTCADSFRLSLKDPDSLVIIANLGTRGVAEDEGKGFWLRYKAKNSYGAFVSSNAYCSKNPDGTAYRLNIHEDTAVLTEGNSILKAKIRMLWAGGNNEDWGNIQDLARINVLESDRNLGMFDYLYQPKDGSPKEKVAE